MISKSQRSTEWRTGRLYELFRIEKAAQKTDTSNQFSTLSWRLLLNRWRNNPVALRDTATSHVPVQWQAPLQYFFQPFFFPLVLQQTNQLSVRQYTSCCMAALCWTKYLKLYSFLSTNWYLTDYTVGSKSFRPDIQKPRQMENAVSDIQCHLWWG